MPAEPLLINGNHIGPILKTHKGNCRFIELISKLLYPNHVIPFKTLNKKLWARLTDDHPKFGKKMTPFKEIPSPGEVQQMLLQGDVESYYEQFGERDSNGRLSFEALREKERAQRVAEIITAPDDEDISSKFVEREFIGHVEGVLSERLEELATEKTTKKDPALKVTQMSWSVHLQYSAIKLSMQDQSTTYFTVMTGELLWLFWPPTPHNVEIMREAYETKKLYPKSTLIGLACKLEEGSICGHIPEMGTLAIPPFSIYMRVATENTVAASYSYFTHKYMRQTLKYWPMCDGWNTTNNNLKGDSLERFWRDEMAPAIRHIDSKGNQERLDELDSTNATIKDDVLPYQPTGAALGDVAVQSACLADNLARIYLYDICPLCHGRFEIKRGAIIAHFQEQHGFDEDGSLALRRELRSDRRRNMGDGWTNFQGRHSDINEYDTRVSDKFRVRKSTARNKRTSLG